MGGECSRSWLVGMRRRRGDQTEAFFNPMLLWRLLGGKLNKENVLRVSSYLPTKQAWMEGGGGREGGDAAGKKGRGEGCVGGHYDLLCPAHLVHRCYEGMFTFTIYPTLFYSKWKVCKEDSVAKKLILPLRKEVLSTAGNS